MNKPLRNQPIQSIADFRAEMARLDLDAFILPRFDAHQAEYVAPHDERLKFLTGFSGSAGMALVVPDAVVMFVDGRYTVQVREECSDAIFAFEHLHENPPEKWLLANASQGWRVGFDPMHLPPTWYDRFSKAAVTAGIALVPLADNPVDAIWADQPPAPQGAITPFPQQFAGRSSAEKCAELVDYLSASGHDFLVETQPDNIAWFLNIRGSDVPFNPLPNSFLIVGRDGLSHWFVDAAKLDDALRDHLPDNVRIFAPDQFLTTLRGLVQAGQNVLIDPGFSPVAVRQVIEEAKAQPIAEVGILTRTKARKNATELEGLRQCHILDGVAMTEFSAWLSREVPERAAAGNPLTEREAEDKVLELRQAQPGFLCESFNSISAAGGNAAMCHYATTETRNAQILPENPYLLDSGGQYDCGTTDVTRSFSFGTLPKDYARAYTAVFKAFHAIATMRFPKGTQGHHIDAICRRPLWDLGYDYDHGTGHGIGHQLSVHEQPQRIGKPYNPIDLTPGMVMSIEPGHYVADIYGIRIENLFEIIENEDGFMEFRNLTWVPIQLDMLDQSALNEEEINWLRNYHAEVRQLLKPRLSGPAIAWFDSQYS